MSTRVVFLILLFWRIGLFIIAFLAPVFFILKPTFTAANDILSKTGYPSWLLAWANFDGIHYFTIASRGYLEVGLVQAFFPAYPVLLSIPWRFAGNPISMSITGQVISFCALFIAVLLFRHILAYYVPRLKGNYATLISLLLLFPTSFYFAAVYTESLFLMLVLGAFFAASKKYWWIAGILIAAASSTRIVGIFLVPALLIELAVQTEFFSAVRHGITPSIAWLKKHWCSVLAITLGSIGLMAYSGYLWYHFNDPLYFFHVQSEFGGGRQESIILFPQVVWRYLKILTSVPLDLRYLTYSLEFLSGVGGLAILIVGYKKVRFSLWFFSLCALILPTLTGTFSSMSRYILVVPAFFLILNELLATRPVLRALWLIVSAILLVLNTMLFVQGYWVA